MLSASCSSKVHVQDSRVHTDVHPGGAAPSAPATCSSPRNPQPAPRYIWRGKAARPPSVTRGGHLLCCARRPDRVELTTFWFVVRRLPVHCFRPCPLSG